MKYQLETIPLWDAVEKSPGICPLCSLMQAAEERHVSYYLGSSVMEPSVRVRVNKEGFCHDHFRALQHAARPQPLALIMHTILQQRIIEMDADLKRLAQIPAAASRADRAAVSRIVDRIGSSDETCLICDDMRTTLARYTYTFVHLIVHEMEYRDAYLGSAGLCIEHAGSVLDMASQEFTPGELAELCRVVAIRLQADLAAAEKDVHWMTQKYKSEYRDAPWSGCEQAQVAAIDRILGKGRVRSQDRVKGSFLGRRR